MSGMGMFGVTISLHCRSAGCTNESSPKIFFALTKSGVLRLESGTDWYVDGSGALCPTHARDIYRENEYVSRIQDESWIDFDRQRVIREDLDG